MKFYSNAKINLGLKVLNKRPDGYHDLESIFIELNVGDEIVFTESNNFKLKTSFDSLKCDDSNTIVKAYNHISCEAFSPGPKDFAAGLDFLNELSSSSNFDYISCNIRNKESELLFKPYKIIDSDGFKIGIIGASSKFENNDVIIDDPYISIKNALSELRDKCDCVILLFNASDADYRLLPRSALDIDLAIRSNTRRKSTDGGNNIFPIYSTGDRGKILYQFDLKYNDKKSSLVDIAYLDKNIKLNKRKILQLTANSADSTDIDIDNQKLDEYNNNINMYSEKINNALNTIQFKQITLNKLIQDNPYILKIVDEGKEKTDQMGSPMMIPHHRHPHDHDGDGYPDH